MTISPVLIESSIQSISCGEPVLYDILVEQQDLMLRIACQQECYDAIAFFKWQQLAIEMAQSHVRNKTDEIRLRIQSESTSLFKSLAYRNSEAQATVQHRGCGWSEASTFTGFRRDSQETFRAVSDKDGLVFGQSFMNASDRGTRDGFGASNAHSQHDTDVQSVTTKQGSVFVRGSHDNFQGTTPTSGGDTTETQNALIGPPNMREVLGVEIPTGLISRENSGNWSDSGANGSFICAACSYDFNNFQQNFGQCAPVSMNRPSISRQGLDRFKGQGTISGNIGFAGIFGASADISWGQEQSFSNGFSQRYVENRHSDYQVDEIFSNGNIDRWMEGRLDGSGSSHDQMTTQHNAQSNSQGFRDSATHTKEATQSNAVADGETHSGAERTAHTERSLQGQSTGGGNAHSHSTTRMDSESSTRAEATYWSQISKALRDMWKLTMQQMVDARAILSASTLPVAGKMKTRYNLNTACYGKLTNSFRSPYSRVH